MEVPGLGFCGQWAMLYIGAAEMAWGAVGGGSGVGPRLATEVARGRGFSAFCSDAHGLSPALSPLSFSDFFLSKLIDSLLVGSNLFTTRAEVLERLPREVAPSRGFRPREAAQPRQATDPRQATSPREAFSLQASIRSTRSICPLEVVSGIGLEGQVASRGI